ncbi:MAG: DUF2023 family protein [Paludibacteraceae bacterium]|nr:DUF2023 family protein [Paludibacteraceae bacterium]MBR4839296.1 DUF2023 family protein [Paludibacteraceae bacterium]
MTKGKTALPSEFMVLSNHIYEYKKGVRNLVLYTLDNRYKEMVCERLESQKIDYLVQPVNDKNVNVYFGEPVCLAAIRTFIHRPLNQLTPEEDFMLGALLGYDICKQCSRFCEKKNRMNA